MIKQKKGAGFTLIELLVVITIIGILATGGISVYTSQLQKARDSSRITNIKSIQSSMEQFNQDNTRYPGNQAEVKSLSGYALIPSDPSTGKECNGSGTTACDFLYIVNSNFDKYELSTGFENKKTVEANGDNAKDQGNDGNRFEMGSDLNLITLQSTKLDNIIGCPATDPTSIYKINADCN